MVIRVFDNLNTGVIPYLPLKAKPTNQLTDKDWTNLKRLMWLCKNNFRMKGSAGHAIWARLRAVTGVKSPEKFSTHHYPSWQQSLNAFFA